MRIRRDPSRGLVISRLPASHLHLLRQIPLHADPAGSPAAESRLYQSPVRSPEHDPDDSLAGDWNDYVLPDLRSDFARQIDHITADLLTARRETRPAEPATGSDAPAFEDTGTDDDDDDAGEADADDSESEDEDEDEDASPAATETYELTIPFDHVEAWYGALNQARLVMQARYDFPEQESLESIVELLASENLKPYLTSRFYTEVQGALLELGMRADDGRGFGS